MLQLGCHPTTVIAKHVQKYDERDRYIQKGKTVYKTIQKCRIHKIENIQKKHKRLLNNISRVIRK